MQKASPYKYPSAFLLLKLTSIENPTVGMQITYNDTCPPEYEPPGFIAAADPRLVVQDEGLEAGDMTTKFHKYVHT
jgi:hypothetical protein